MSESFTPEARRRLARQLSRLARGEALPDLPPPARPSRVIAVTGSGGVGKSSLIGKLIEAVRRRGLTVAVLACDPQSPLSGGALLGDRFRMPARPDDEGVYIRSLAAVSGRGAVAEHLGPMVRLLEGCGFGVIVIETVGAGQGDVAVRELADVVVLLLQPETGDDLQWEKAGILEVADVIVIHKADLPGAEQVEAQVRTALGLAGETTTPVLRVSARSGTGVDQLTGLLLSQPLRRPLKPSPGAELLRLAQQQLSNWFTHAESAGDPRVIQLLSRWQRGEVPADEAAYAVLALAAQQG